MKKILYRVFLLLAVLLFGLWLVFMRPKTVENEQMVTICLDNNRLKIETAEAVKYISEVTSKTSNDTIEITVKDRLIGGFYTDRSLYQTINIGPDVKYLKFLNKVKPLNEIRKCSF